MTTAIGRARSSPIRPGIRLLREQPSPVLDSAIALVVIGIECGLLVDNSGEVPVLALLATVLGGAALVWQVRWPVVALAVTLAVTLTLAFTGSYPGGATVLVAMFTTARLMPRGVSLAAMVPTMVLLQLGSVCSPPVTIGAWAIGVYAQTRHRYLTTLEERTADLERERDHVRQIAVQEERASIAREMHDIVSHSVTVLLLGIRGARDTLRSSPDAAEDTLRRAEEAAEDSMVELRRILVLLRSPDTVAELEPAPGIGDVAVLVESHRAEGMPVELTVEGASGPLPAGTELAVYRVVQEALTNVVRHADPTLVHVRLRLGPTSIAIDVQDDGATQSGPGAEHVGHGLIGLRERMNALGGTLTSGPVDGHGYRVAATVPVGAA